MDFGAAKEFIGSLNMDVYQKSMMVSVNEASGLKTLKLDMMQSLALALCIYYLGVFLKKKFPILEKFCIPSPVVGGITFAILNLVMMSVLNFSIGLDTTLQKPFMMVFFTTIGMGASVTLLKKGGVGVVLFLALASVLCIFQDAIGIVVAKMLGQNPLLGLVCGSVTMTGGHGTGAAFAPKLEEMGLQAANVVAASAATFGLVTGSLMGGPLGAALIRRKNLKPVDSQYKNKNLDVDTAKDVVNFDEMFKTLAVIAVSIAIGAVMEIPLKKMNITLPAYVNSMIIAAIILNVGESSGGWKINQTCVGILGSIGLNAFLSLALCGMRLWELKEVFGPMLIILAAQAALMAIFAYFVTFNVMGRDFDAAVLAAGHCGFGMGATPNGVANMTSVQEEFGPAPRAFFILPVVGAFFIDLTNGAIIPIFMNIAAKM